MDNTFEIDDFFFLVIFTLLILFKDFVFFIKRVIVNIINEEIIMVVNEVMNLKTTILWINFLVLNKFLIDCVEFYDTNYIIVNTILIHNLVFVYLAEKIYIHVTFNNDTLNVERQRVDVHLKKIPLKKYSIDHLSI